MSYTAIDNGWRALGKKKLKMDNDMWERAFREMSEIRRLLDSAEKRRPLRMPDGIQVRKKTQKLANSNSNFTLEAIAPKRAKVSYINFTV